MGTIVGIYGFRCTESGKWYVGQSINVLVRKRDHLIDLRRGRHPNSHMQSAFDKYGESSFEFHVLEETPEDMLDARECSWIEYLRSTDRDFGYNLDTGGHFKKHHSLETRAKMSAWQTGLKRPPHTPEARAKMSAAHKGRRVGPFSIETRAKMSAWQRGRKLPPETIAKLSSARRGVKRGPMSQEQKDKLSELRRGENNPNWGRKHSKASREKMSESRRQKNLIRAAA